MRGDSYCLYHAQYRVYANQGSSQEALPIPAACLMSHVSRTTPSHNPRTRHRGGIGQFRIRAGRHNECGLFQMRWMSRVPRIVCSSRSKKSPRPGTPRVERARLSSPGIPGVKLSNQKRSGDSHTLRMICSLGVVLYYGLSLSRFRILGAGVNDEGKIKLRAEAVSAKT